jgi:pimeloyl-ACP methyl ester carboxylesterase
LGLIGLGVRSFAPALSALNAIRPPLDLLMSLTRPITDRWQPVNHALLQSWPISWTMRALLLQRTPALPQLWRAYLEDRTLADTRVDMTSWTLVGDAALRTALQTIRAPTLCIAGRSDRLVSPAAVTAAQQLIPGSELRLLDGCGHLPMVEHPELLYQTLRQFFE